MKLCVSARHLGLRVRNVLDVLRGFQMFYAKFREETPTAFWDEFDFPNKGGDVGGLTWRFRAIPQLQHLSENTM